MKVNLEDWNKFHSNLEGAIYILGQISLYI